MTDAIARCACCGSEAATNSYGNKRFAACLAPDCFVGPARHSEAEAITAWNALMTREKPTPEGAVRLEIPVHYSPHTEQFIIKCNITKTGSVTDLALSEFPYFAAIIAHIVPPVPQVVDGEVA